MAFRMKRKNDSILLMRHSPDYQSTMLGFGLLLIATFVCVILGGMISTTGLAIITTFISLVGLTWQERELYCVINRATGVITYTKGGILNTQYDFHKVQYQLAEVIALEMKRHVSREWDTFQIRLVLVGNRIVPLSYLDLGFSECQIYVNEIRQFIGLDKPIRAID